MSFFLGIVLVITGLATLGNFWHAVVLIGLGLSALAFSEWNTKTPKHTIVQNFERDHGGEVIKATSEHKIA